MENKSRILYKNSEIFKEKTATAVILLIEDNKNILENLSEFFAFEGYKTLSANDGEQGVALARKFIPDLILCDIKMTQMDGYEVLRLILNMSKTYEIPFIFSTANSENVEKIKAIELGADDYIIKPYRLENLLILIKKWIKSGSCRHTEFPQKRNFLIA